MALMKENQKSHQINNSAIFAQPFKVGGKKSRRSTSDPLSMLQNEKKTSEAESSSQQQKEYYFKESEQVDDKDIDPLNAFNNANFDDIIEEK